MPDALGHKSYFQIGAESTHGTGVAATAKLEMISCGIKPILASIPDPSLYDSRSPRSIIQGPYLFRGPIVVRLNFEGMIRLFEMAFGSLTTTTPETGVRDHTFKEAATLPSKTLEVVRGNIPAGQCEDFVGCKCDKMTIRGSAEQGPGWLITGEFDILAKDKLTGQTPATLSFPPIFPVKMDQLITIDDGTADAPTEVKLKSFEVTLENRLIADDLQGGSLTADEPVPGELLVASFSVTKKFRTKTLADAAKAATTGSPQFVFQHPTTIGSTSKREFELRMGTATLDDYDDPVNGYGHVLQTARWIAAKDVTDASALVARFRNTETAP